MVEITHIGQPAAINLRGAGPTFATAVRVATGLDCPHVANTYASLGDRALLWLGPDEIMLLDAQAEGTALEQELVASLGSHASSVCDVSDNRAMIAIEGPGATELLARGCALNLDKMEPGKSCAQTMVARAQAILVRRAPDRFDIMPRLSFADYLTDWLSAAAKNL